MTRNSPTLQLFIDVYVRQAMVALVVAAKTEDGRCCFAIPVRDSGARSSLSLAPSKASIFGMSLI